MKVGDYVRTKNGLIGKLFGCEAYDENKIAIHTRTDKNSVEITSVIDKSTIVKSSPNIIDLIEVGDYVNGYNVLEICPSEKGMIAFIVYRYKYSSYTKILDMKNIKSILTKEQFEREVYVIDEV